MNLNFYLNPFMKLTLLLILSISLTFNSFSQSKTVGLLKHLKGTQENGYVLFSPIKVDTTYLLDRCGKKVHQWASAYSPGLAMYIKPNGHLLRAETYTDTSFKLAGGRGGLIEEFDWDNNLVWSYKIFNDSLCQHHDIKPMPNGNILVLTWHAISKAKAIALGRDSAYFSSDQLWGERLIELKPIGIDSAEIVWQWDLFDHVIQNKNNTLPTYGQVSSNPQLVNINYAHDLQTYDWIHANGIDYNANLDQIVISCHNLSEIWIVDHSTSTAQAKTHSGGNANKGGDLLYRWGNPEAYDQGGPLKRKLFRQHNAHWIPNGLKDSGCIMLFNNGWGRDTSYSTIDVIKTPLLAGNKYNPNLPYLPNTLTWQYKDSVPTNFFSQIISGCQRLANGNTLICSGIQGRFFEVTSQKKIVWEYRMPINNINIQTDGDFPRNNNVFRCTFYPNTFPGFKNRNLSPYGTVEKSSYVYSCNYENVPPKLVALSPANNATSVVAKPTISFTFDETVLKKKGLIQIFQNNILLETLPIDSPSVVVNNNLITLKQKNAFAINSRISILVPASGFRDSSNNLSKVIDSSAWHFYTVVPSLNLDSVMPKHLSADIEATRLLKLFFRDSVFKGSTGGLRIYENNVLKESIPITSNNIIINGKIITVTPSTPFALDASIAIELDASFKNSIGVYNTPITKGAWIFTTRSTPKIVQLTPSNKLIDVVLNPTLIIEYDRPIKIGNNGNLIVYEDGFPVDAISLNGPRTMISGNSISFDLNSDLLEGARVAIELDANLLVDTFGSYCSAIDSSSWTFTTLKNNNSRVNALNTNKNFAVYPNPNNGLFVLMSTEKIETLQLFDGTGKQIEISFDVLNEKQYQIKLNQFAKGHYVLLVNGHNAVNLLLE